MSGAIPITRLRKQGGALLCKRIALGDQGKPVSDGSPCAMTRGESTLSSGQWRLVLDALGVLR